MSSTLIDPPTKTEERSESKSPKWLQNQAAADATESEFVPTTMIKAVSTFFTHPGPSLVVMSLSGMIFTRLGYTTGVSTSPWTILDTGVASLAVILWWIQEHVMHQHLLHSSADWIGKSIHENHHEQPYFHVSIDPPALILGWLWSVFVILASVLPLTLALSATLGYGIAGLVYEWTHFIVHTRVKPRTAFGKLVRDHHMRHHLVDSRFWFGFSMPQIDTLMNTNPTVQQVRQIHIRERQQEQHDEELFT